MKLTNRKLQKTLTDLAKSNATAWHLRDLLSRHCEAVYGVDPADIDNDTFIDAVDGGCGAACGMTADEFHKSMMDRMQKLNIPLPADDL